LIKILEALAVFTGTIVGAGIFALPYIAFKAGFGTVAFYFIILTILTLIIHLMLAEVSRETQKSVRITGYAEEYLGKGWKNFSLLVSSLGLLGALLAYLILGGKFMASYFSPYFGGPIIVYTLIFFAFGAGLIYKGVKSIAKVEVVMLGILLLILLLFLTKGLPYIDLKNLTTFNPKFLALPYGAILFSLWGLTMIPEIKEMEERDRKKIWIVTISGIILSAFCYLSFVFVVLGASGNQTSPDALSGFAATLGSGVANLGFVFGLLTVFTSFIGLGLAFKNILKYDLKLPEKTSWAITCFLPLILYLVGFKNFIQVISLTGAVALGLEAIIVIFIYKNFLEKRFQRKPTLWIYPLGFLFLLGMTLQLLSPIFF
jgi:amino acid permease